VDEKREAANSCYALCTLHMHTKLENGVQVPGNGQQVKIAFTSLYELQRHYRLENLCVEIQLFFENTKPISHIKAELFKEES